jgi:hypothetical protein
MSYIKALSCSDPTWLDPLRPVKAPFDDPPARSAICSATACVSVTAPTFAPPAKASRPCLALKSVLPLLPMVAGLSANHLAALQLPLPCAVSVSPATTMRPV